MWTLLHVEFEKVLRNKVLLTFLILLSIYCVCTSVLHTQDSNSIMCLSIDTVGRDSNGILKSDVGLYGTTLYNQWIGGIGGHAFYPTLFYLLLPLLCVIPYGASFFSDKKTGYQRMLCLKKGKTAYVMSKYIATFFSGFILIFIPLLINFLTTACLVPAYKPDPFDSAYYAVSYNQAFSALFYTHPLAYSFIYILLASIFAGLWATVPLAMSFFVRNRYMILFLPYIFLLFLMDVCDLLFYFRVYIEASPLYFLRAASGRNPNNLYVIFFECFLTFTVTLIITIWKGAKEDVF